MLTLKYLYEAKQFDQVAKESAKYRADTRSEAYLPQILYISWVTHRREGNAETAEKLQEMFLKKFPQHPLGADMHFSSAMSALANGNYAEALRLLEIVEYRYPKSRIASKVKKLQERLWKSQSGEKRE